MNSKDRNIILAGSMLTFIAIAGALISGKELPLPPSGEGADLAGYEVYTDSLGEVATEYGGENTETDHAVVVDFPLVTAVRFTLLWTDEPDSGPRFTNEPDIMTLEVAAPDAAMMSDGPSDTGSLQVAFTYPEPREFPYNEWQVTVKVGDCGDQVPVVDILGLRAQSDDGNTYVVNGEVDHLARSDESGSGGGGRAGGDAIYVLDLESEGSRAGGDAPAPAHDAMYMASDRMPGPADDTICISSDGMPDPADDAMCISSDGTTLGPTRNPHVGTYRASDPRGYLPGGSDIPGICPSERPAFRHLKEGLRGVSR
jgi:hypothetical protein